MQQPIFAHQGQPVLRCYSYADFRTVANALAYPEAQVDRFALMLRTGIRDNQTTATHKVDFHRAGVLADQLAVMRKDVRRIEVALREAAIQGRFRASRWDAAGQSDFALKVYFHGRILCLEDGTNGEAHVGSHGTCLP